MGNESLGAPVRTGPGGYRSLLLEEGGLTQQDVQVAEQHAAREGIPLAESVTILGLLPEVQAYELFARSVPTTFTAVDEQAPSELALRLIPERVARRYGILPLAVDNRVLTYATSRPLNDECDRDIAFASGRKAVAWVARRSALLDAIDRAYPKTRELDVLASRLKAEGPAVEANDLDRARPSESAVIEMCNHIIGRAVDVGASDVHIESGSQGLSVRFRICGVLEPLLTLPASVALMIRNRFKILARADIAVRHKPQDGAFRVKVNGRAIDVRLSALPTVDGEKIVLRVIDSLSPLQTLDRLGYDENTTTRLIRALSRPDGLVLVTGPTGSGKTTALYAALSHLRTGRTNIVSVEDPVERMVPGITQIPVNTRGGNTFPVVLRSLLRQDPNVIMVGEVRDGEVAQIVGQAAYTGHLVLASMHTADAATAILRLQNLGLEPFKIAESLRAVVAQRLIRPLCPECRRLHNDIDAARLGEQHGIRRVPAYAGAGCPRCKLTGYVGRIPVAELLTPSDAMREAIAQGATAHDMRLAMRSAGFPSMRDHALQLVEAGTTSIDEVNRVLADDGETAKAARTKLRVLVTDDEPITRMLVKLLLEQQRYEVLEATNGQLAIEIAARERPDLILMDLHMPEMDGYEAIRRMRRDLALTTTPILVVTAEDGPGVEQRVLELGADDYIVKPFEPTILLSRVNAVFRRLGTIAA